MEAALAKHITTQAWWVAGADGGGLAIAQPLWLKQGWNARQARRVLAFSLPTLFCYPADGVILRQGDLRLEWPATAGPS